MLRQIWWVMCRISCAGFIERAMCIWGAVKVALCRWRSRWKLKHPGRVINVHKVSGHLLEFFACPELHWEYAHYLSH